MSIEAKYQPRSLADLVFPNDAGEGIIRAWASGQFDHLLFHGAHGSGKSTMAELLPQIAVPGIQSADILVIDSKDDTSKRKLITRITNFASQLPMNVVNGGGVKFIVIDEFEGLKAHQERLRVSMDKNKHICFWLLCTNDFPAIDSGIIDRCELVDFEMLAAERMRIRAAQIVESEGKTVSDRKLDTIVLKSGSSWRTLLRQIQKLP